MIKSVRLPWLRSLGLALALTAQSALAEIRVGFPDGTQTAYDAITNKLIVFGKGGPTVLEYELPRGKPPVYWELVDPVVEEHTWITYYTGVLFTYANGSALHVDAALFVPPRQAGALTERAAPLETFSVAVSNDADRFEVVCDNRRAVFVGANSATPVSLVDLAARRETATVPYPGKLARAVAIGDDDRTVAVILDNTTNSNANAVRRLTLGPGDTLIDAGEELSFGSDFASKVAVAAGSKVGVALVGQFPARLVSFTLPGLAIRSSVPLAQGIGSSVIISPPGERIYARSGRRGVVPDVIEGFVLDRNTGTINPTPVLRIDNVAGFTGTATNEPMALSTDGTVLVAIEATPSARFTQFSTATGAVVGTIADPVLQQSTTVRTGGRCGKALAVRPAIEYYNAALDHYFISWMPDEIATLDAGVSIKGWARTGKSIAIYPAIATSSSPVCRYYIPPLLGDSHFFGRGTVECNATGQKNPSFVLEDPAFMNIALPTAGVCPSNTRNVYRVFSNRRDANHRYTTDKAVRDEMVAKGWLAEGDGPDLVVMCAPG